MFYELEDAATANLEAEDRDELMGRWLSALETITGDICRKGVDQLMAEIGEIPYAWLNGSDEKLRAEGVPEEALIERQTEQESGGRWIYIRQYHERAAYDGNIG